MIVRIITYFEKSFRAGTKQEIVDHLFVPQHQWGQVPGECEDHVQIARGEQFLLTRRDPFFASRSLTLRTVAVTTAVVRNGGTMSAADALIENLLPTRPTLISNPLGIPGHLSVREPIQGVCF